MPPSGTFTQASSAWKSWFMAIAAGVLLTAALTYPTVRSIGTLGRVNAGDGRFSIWNVGWVAHALNDEPRRVLDANIFFPHTRTLTYSELNLVAGVLAAPVYRFTRNPVAALNSAVLLALFLTFLAMWALVRRVSGSPGAGLVAATGYTFSAYTAAHTAQIQLLMIFGFPLSLLALHRLAARPTVAAGVWLGLVLGLTALACGYYGVFAGIMVALGTLFLARASRAYWIAIGSAAVVTAAIVLPVFYLYISTRAAAGAPAAPPPSELRLFAGVWTDYFRSGTVVGSRALEALSSTAHAAFPTVVAPTTQFPDVLFPGFVVTLLAIVGFVTGLFARGDRRLVLALAATAIVAAWASFGPDAHLYSAIAKVVPGASLVRASSRFGILVIFALAVLAGFGLKRLNRPWVAPVCLALLVAELWVPWPLEAMPALPQAYTRLRDLPRGGVVEFPFPYIRTDFHQHTRAMLRSTANWQPLVNGYSDFTPADFYALAEPINGFPNQAAFDIMRARGVKYVIVRLPDYGAAQYQQAMRDRFPPYEKYLRRLTADQDVWLLEIIGWPESTEK